MEGTLKQKRRLEVRQTKHSNEQVQTSVKNAGSAAFKPMEEIKGHYTSRIMFPLIYLLSIKLKKMNNFSSENLQCNLSREVYHDKGLVSLISKPVPYAFVACRLFFKIKVERIRNKLCVYCISSSHLTFFSSQIQRRRDSSKLCLAF